MMLGSGPKVAVQDPSYPVYVDTSVIMGMTGNYNPEGTHFNNVSYMPCRPENGFFPDLSVVSPSGSVQVKHQHAYFGNLYAHSS